MGYRADSCRRGAGSHARASCGAVIDGAGARAGTAVFATLEVRSAMPPGLMAPMSVEAHVVAVSLNRDVDASRIAEIALALRELRRSSRRRGFEWWLRRVPGGSQIWMLP